MIEQLTGLTPIVFIPTFVVVSLTSYILYFYYRVSTYPPGPTPLPFVGNFLKFRGNPNHIHEIINSWGDSHGGICTMWIANRPTVIISDPDAVIEAYKTKQNEFAGRDELPPELKEIIFQGKNNTDVATTDFNREWEVMRRIIHSAALKYSRNQDLPLFISRVVDDTAEEMMNKAPTSGYCMKNFLFTTVFSIICSIAFGKDYRLDDPEFQRLYQNAVQKEKFDQERGSILFVFWFGKYLNPGRFQKFKDIQKLTNNYLNSQFDEHVRTFDRNRIRDFTDAVLLAKLEAEEEDEEKKEVLHRGNLINLVLDLFIAGTDTSKDTLNWIILLLSNYPDQQEEIRKSIIDAVGEDPMNHSDRDKVPLLSAFIAEVMRFRPIAPFGIAHKTTVDTEVAGVKLRKGTPVLASIITGLHKKDAWGDPEVFRPNRFIGEDGKFIARPNQYYNPFSIGRRACPGDRLAVADMFFVIARLLQKTNGFSIQLEHGSGSISLDGDPYKMRGFHPHDYKVKLVSTS